MHFTNKDGVSRYGRYRIVPEAGNDHLDDATAAGKSANYLFDELTERIAKGAIRFRIPGRRIGLCSSSVRWF